VACSTLNFATVHRGGKREGDTVRKKNYRKSGVFSKQKN